jgi:predicted metal-binding membrane protein
VADFSDPLERWLYGGALAGLIGGAWLALGLLGASAYAPYFSHEIAQTTGVGALGTRAALFVVGWVMMSVAMMLPSSLPLVTVFRTIAPRSALLVPLIAGYLSTWGLFGLTAFLADAGLHTLVDRFPTLQARADLIAPSLLLLAGLFQFSPLKYSCLTQCRSPVGFVMRYWRGGRHVPQAFSLGVRHGVFCVGCCWALMLLMLGVGGIHLGWMLALGAIMFVEKAVSWGRWITVPAGGILTLWALALFLRVPGMPHPF